MAKEVFRFHVLANSDSEEDQELKMKVKGEIIAYMKEDLPYSDGVETTKAWARTHTDEIEEVAARTIEEAGYDYPVKAKVTTCYFPDKTYGDVTFPQGEYEALRIEIGEGKRTELVVCALPESLFYRCGKCGCAGRGKRRIERSTG